MASTNSISDDDGPSSHNVNDDPDWNSHVRFYPGRPTNEAEEREMIERAKRLSLVDDPQYSEAASIFTNGTIHASQTDPSPTPAGTSSNSAETTSSKKKIPETPAQPPLTWTNPSHTWEEAMQLRFGAEILKINHPQGDTAVYIDPPPREPSQDEASYRKNFHHFESPHVLRSKDLKDLGSPKFEAMLAPTTQYRMKRRLANAGFDVHLDEKIEYYLDLRVPVHEEEAMILLEGLTCTSGILAWVKARNNFGIPKKFVCGEDNPSSFEGWSKSPNVPQQKSILEKYRDQKNKEQKETEESSQKKKNSDQPEKILNWEGRLPQSPPAVQEDIDKQEAFSTIGDQHDRKPDIIQTPNIRTEPPLQQDYSPLRHRSAIERLLHAAGGGDPRLDSAPKMWTYFAIAKYFECAENPKINTWITVWLLDTRNSNFVQANPEVTYRIGLGIKSEYLVQAAFSILAAERALAIANSPNAPATARLASVHRTRVEHLDDDEKNRVDHAANQFLHRITRLFHGFVDENPCWLNSVPEYKVLAEHDPGSAAEAVAGDRLLATLKLHVRARIYSILGRGAQRPSPDLEENHKPVTDFYPLRKGLPEVYDELSCSARLLTRTFWNTLHNERWQENTFTNFDPRVMPCPPNARPEIHLPFRCPSTTEVQMAIDDFNSCLRHRSHLRPARAGFAPSPNWENNERFPPAPDNSNNHLGDDGGGTLLTRFFDIYAFFQGVESLLRGMIEILLHPAHMNQDGFGPPTFLLDTLLCLNDDEFKYLPLWAGGFDDGETGAVFEDADVPLLETGGFAPGAGIHSAASAANSEATDGGFSDVASTAAGTVVAASHKATEGTRTATASDYDVVSAMDMEVEAEDMDEVWEQVEREGQDKGKSRGVDMESLMEDENADEDEDLDADDNDELLDDFMDDFEDVEME